LIWIGTTDAPLWPMRSTGHPLARVLATTTLVIAASCGSDDGEDAQRESAPVGVMRRYYLAAEDVEWNYAPGGNQAGTFFDSFAPTFIDNAPYTPATGMNPADARIGRKYMKALYREYTDATFATLKPRPPEWAHLGALGPLIRAQVGDTIEVVFKNRTAYPFSVHAHGVFYDKSSEGAPYPDGTGPGEKPDDAVPSEGMHTYVWKVPERAGPAAGDGSSILWMYHSHVDETSDTYAGLIGPMIITGLAKARPDGSPRDVDREFVTLFHIYNENHSHYLARNAETYANLTSETELEAATESEDFAESNLMHSVNGYVYANIPGLEMKLGQRVRWYVFAMGTEVDLHTPHWHGATVTAMHSRTDIVQLLPGMMLVADMIPDIVGAWLYHCHVNDHIDAGMLATFAVVP
jgi:manganese oxidase